jgi:hypothetical protein
MANNSSLEPGYSERQESYDPPTEHLGGHLHECPPNETPNEPSVDVQHGCGTLGKPTNDEANDAHCANNTLPPRVRAQPQRYSPSNYSKRSRTNTKTSSSRSMGTLIPAHSPPRKHHACVCQPCDYVPLTRSDFVRHLNREHADLSTNIPANVLQDLGLESCSRCQSLKVLRARCPCCKGVEVAAVANERPTTNLMMEAEAVEAVEVNLLTMNTLGHANELPLLQRSIASTGEQVMPTIAEIYQASWTTLTVIPDSIFHDWATIFLDELSMLVSKPSCETWSRVVLSTKLLLAEPLHGGKQKQDATDRLLKRRISRWRSGGISALWWDCAQAWAKKQSGHPQPRQTTQSTLPPRLLQRVRQLIAAGLPGKACATLCSRGVHTLTPELALSVRDLFPPRQTP